MMLRGKCGGEANLLFPLMTLPHKKERIGRSFFYASKPRCILRQRNTPRIRPRPSLRPG